MEVLPIEESVELVDKYPSVVDRYFTRQYVMGQQKDDICLLFHSNKICVVTLAKTHIILKDDKSIKSVNFKVSKNVDRTENKVKGKGKRGGQIVEENSILCIIQCEDGSEYPIKAGVKGKLVEVNENLIANPELLKTKTETNGYIAVVVQRLGDRKNDPNYVSQEEYDDMNFE